MNKFSFKKYLLAGLAVLSLVGDTSACTMQKITKANRQMEQIIVDQRNPYYQCIKLMGETEFACSNSRHWKRPCVLTWDHTLAVCKPFLQYAGWGETEWLAEQWEKSHS